MLGKQEVQDLIRQLGGPAHLARELARCSGRSITRPAVSQWVRIPIAWVLHVERIAVEQGLPFDRHVLRPDVFGSRAPAVRKRAS